MSEGSEQRLFEFAGMTLRLVEVTRDLDGNATGFRAVTLPDGEPVNIRAATNDGSPLSSLPLADVTITPWLRRR